MKKLILTIGILGLVTAQVLGQFTNNSLIYIGDDAVVSIGMETTNNGQITNNGDLLVKENLVNNAIFASNGNLNLMSDIGLLIAGDRAIEANNINLEGDVFLKTPLQVGNQLNFVHGMIFVDENSSLNFGPNANFINANDFSHVVGKITKSGEGAFTFPLGDGYNMRDFEVREIGGRTIAANYVARSPLDISSELDYDVERINVDEYWTIQSNNASRVEVGLKNNDVVSLNRGVWVNSNKGLSVNEGESAFTSGNAKNFIKEIGVWPNPTDGEFNLKLTGMRDSDEITVDITNQDGRVIRTMKGKVYELRKAYTLPSNLAATDLKIRVINGDEVLTQSLIYNR